MAPNKIFGVLHDLSKKAAARNQQAKHSNKPIEMRRESNEEKKYEEANSCWQSFPLKYDGLKTT